MLIDLLRIIYDFIIFYFFLFFIFWQGRVQDDPGPPYQCASVPGRLGNAMFAYASSLGAAVLGNRTLVVTRDNPLLRHFSLNALVDCNGTFCQGAKSTAGHCHSHGASKSKVKVFSAMHKWQLIKTCIVLKSKSKDYFYIAHISIPRMLKVLGVYIQMYRG
jgi:hypothetical protein